MLVTVVLGILTVAGAVPTFILMRERLRGRRPLRRLLGLGGSKIVEMMITTSSTEISSVGPDDETQRAVRALVPTGDLAGVAELSVMLANSYPSKTFVLTPSASPRRQPAADMMIIGGPVHNDFAKALIEGSMHTAGVGSEIIFDAPHRYIKFGPDEYGPNLDLKFVDNVPSVDYGLVLLGRIPALGRAQRVLLVAGLTTYGTHGAAYFAAHELAAYASSQKLGRAPNVVVLVRSTLVNGQPVSVQAERWIMFGPRSGSSLRPHKEPRSR